MVQLDKLIDMHSAATGKSKIDLSNGLDASDVMGMTQLAEQHGIKVPPGVMKKMYAPFSCTASLLLAIHPLKG